MTGKFTRRQVMGAAAAAGVMAGADWRFSKAWARESTLGWNDGFNAGPVHHLLPTVSHDRLRLKASFVQALKYTPELSVDGRKVKGQRADRHGRFWNFDVSGLEPARTYELRLHNESGRAITDHWPLTTFPHPDAKPERLRVLVYTCAGGVPDFITPDGKMVSLPHAVRRRLISRGLSFKPDAVISNGDHIYWDQAELIYGDVPAKTLAFVKEFRRPFGEFDRSLPVLGTNNEDVLARVGDNQIADLYGVGLRSVPVFFIMDDHDYFEGDKANDKFVTFPPDPFSMQLGRTAQHFYYPEFILGPNQPAGLPDVGACDRAPGLSEIYGVLRYGRLAEILMYDTRRYTRLDGPSAVFVAKEAEKWLISRTAAEKDASHLIHVPSQPVGWSAGKWMDFYPDVLKNGELTTKVQKPYWQQGWFNQHQRLLQAASAQKSRPAFMIEGDMHMIGAGKIMRSGDLDFSANPVTTVVAGPPGPADGAWPSGGRGTPPKVATALDMKTILGAQERNGFTILDISHDRIDVRIFSWRRPEPEEAIDTLEPTVSFSVERLA